MTAYVSHFALRGRALPRDDRYAFSAVRNREIRVRRNADGARTRWTGSGEVVERPARFA